MITPADNSSMILAEGLSKFYGPFVAVVAIEFLVSGVRVAG